MNSFSAFFKSSAIISARSEPKLFPMESGLSGKPLIFGVRWFHLRLGYGATGEVRFEQGDGEKTKKLAPAALRPNNRGR
jgi:hypothetical protein